MPEEGGAEFWRAVDQLEAMLRDRGVSLETTGPLPPYHFVAVELRERAGA